MDASKERVVDAKLTIEEAGRMWGLSKGAVYNGKNSGRFPFFKREHAHGPWLAREEDVLAAPVFSQDELVDRAETNVATLVDAQNAKLIRQHPPNVRKPFSLNDVEALKRHASGAKKSVDPFADVAEFAFRKAVDVYIERELRPGDLPPWFWRREPMPEFVPPANVFRLFAMKTYVRIDTTGTYQVTVLGKSGGHSVRQDEAGKTVVEYMPGDDPNGPPPHSKENPREVVGEWPAGTDPQIEWVRQENAAYWTAFDEWESAYWKEQNRK